MGAREWREDPGLAAWSALLRVHATVVRAVDADVQRRGGLPLAWYDVLLELNAAPRRRLRMQDLAEVAVLSRSRVSRIVDELEQEGLVAREANPEDRRSAFAVVTPAGRRALRASAPYYLDAVRRRFVDGVPDELVAGLRDALESVLQHPAKGDEAQAE